MRQTQTFISPLRLDPEQTEEERCIGFLREMDFEERYSRNLKAGYSGMRHS